VSKKRAQTLRLCWLEAFLAVIDNDGVKAKAAEDLGLHESTVGRYLEDLREWFGFPLYDVNQPPGLTQQGFAFADTAREVVSILENARMTETPKVETSPPRRSAKDIKIKRGAPSD